MNEIPAQSTILIKRQTLLQLKNKNIREEIFSISTFKALPTHLNLHPKKLSSATFQLFYRTPGQNYLRVHSTTRLATLPTHGNTKMAAKYFYCCIICVAKKVSLVTCSMAAAFK